VDHVNLVKLCVGARSIDELIAWREAHPSDLPGGLRRHVTRMWPRREAELIAGGSLYWVIRGAIRARQRIVRLDEVIGEDGIRRCALIMAPEIVRTARAPRRPFQGWRYLAAADAPPDLPGSHAQGDTLPPELLSALADIGVR